MQANLRWHRPRPIYKTVGSGEITGWKWNNYVLHDQTPLLTSSSDKIRLPLNVGNSSGVNVQPWPGSGGLFEGLSHRRTFSSRTHGRPTSMAFSQACLSSVLKKLVQEAPSLAAVRTSERRAISPRGSSCKVSQPRRGGEPPGESMGAATNCLLFGGRGTGEEEIRA